MTIQDRIAFDLSGGDGSRFRLIKKLDLEDVCKQLWILNERAEEARNRSKS